MRWMGGWAPRTVQQLCPPMDLRSNAVLRTAACAAVELELSHALPLAPLLLPQEHEAALAAMGLTGEAS